MPEDVENLTLPQIFQEKARQYSSRPGLFYKNIQTKKFCPILWKEWAEKVTAASVGLFQLGVRRGDKIAILSENRPEWTYADLGILSLGAASVPIYPTSSPEDVLYILENAEVQVLFLSSENQWNRLKEELQKSRLRMVISFDPIAENSSKLISMANLLTLGKVEDKQNPGLYRKLLETGDPLDLATIIYTSGTTGPPKGVMLSHQNFVSNYLGCKSRIQISEKDSALSFLPLSHVFERLAGYYYMAFHGAPISYAESMQTVAEDIQVIRPTVCAAVPRFYEKIYAKIMENVNSGPSFKRKIFEWAVHIGKKRAVYAGYKKSLPMPLAISYFFARLLVFNKIKNKMGGRLRFFISGGAPLSKDLAEFFYAADVLILEGYGLTETSPVIAVNSENNFRFGTVGLPLSNLQVKIAPDGEILVKGPSIMKGYYRNPEATAEALQDGWFHTGDIGELLEGFLKITDRKKDIIATSGGKKVSPQNIEARICSDNLFLQVVLIGDKKNYLVALVVPNKHLIIQYAASLQMNLTYEELLKNSKIREWIDKRFHEKTSGLASYEQIKYYALLPKEFCQEAGELTPTLKYKRKFIMEKYRDIIESLYHSRPESAIN